MCKIVGQFKFDSAFFTSLSMTILNLNLPVSTVRTITYSDCRFWSFDLRVLHGHATTLAMVVFNRRPLTAKATVDGHVHDGSDLVSQAPIASTAASKEHTTTAV